MQHNFKSFLDALPSSRSLEDTTEKYMFIDTRKVVEDMLDLGYEVAGFRRPKFRTNSGAYGVHEVDFRRPQDVAKNAAEAPRVLFINSYDGSKRAQFISGLIRFACSNGLVIGDFINHEKFLHLGDYADQLIDGLKKMAGETARVFDRIDHYQSIEPDAKVLEDMAFAAATLRFGNPEDPETPKVDLNDLLQPRREEDLRPDLWTKWNVLQENIMKGGVPLKNTKGQARLSGPVGNIDRSNELNRSLWNVLDEAAELVA